MKYMTAILDDAQIGAALDQLRDIALPWNGGAIVNFVESIGIVDQANAGILLDMLLESGLSEDNVFVQHLRVHISSSTMDAPTVRCILINAIQKTMQDEAEKCFLAMSKVMLVLSGPTLEIYPPCEKPKWLVPGAWCYCLGEGRDIFTIDRVFDTAATLLRKDGCGHGMESFTKLYRSVLELEDRDLLKEKKRKTFTEEDDT